MDVMVHESPTSRRLFSSRSQALDNLEAKFHAWSDNAKALLSDIRRREEQLRAAQQEQLKRKHLEAEAAEKLRREQAESEAKLKAEEARRKQEREREEREAAELLHRERLEAEERMHVEGEPVEEAKQTRSEAELPISHAFPSVADDTFPVEDGRGMMALHLIGAHLNAF